MAIVLLLAVLNVSFAAGLLAWAAFVPVGFLLDPLFNRLGRWLLLEAPPLRPLWTAMADVPGLALTNFQQHRRAGEARSGEEATRGADQGAEQRAQPAAAARPARCLKPGTAGVA